MKKILALTLALAMVLSLAACSKPAETAAPTTAPTQATTAPTAAPTKSGETKATEAPTVAPTEPKQPEEKIMKLIVQFAGTTLNPLISNSTETEKARQYHGQLYTIVYAEDGSKIYIPVYAAGMPEKADAEGLVWNIPVLETTFSDGVTPINAEVWEYTFKMLLDPVLANVGGDYLDTKIMNGTSYYKNEEVNGKKLSWEDVGIKAIDKKTLQISYNAAPASALEVAKGFTTYHMSPIDPTLFESLMAADRASCQYGTSVANTKFSGAFEEVEWVQEAKHIMVKNKYFPLADEVKLTGMEIYEITNVQTRTEMYDNNEAYCAKINAELGTVYMDSPDFFGAYSRYILQLEINDQRAYYEADDKTLGTVKKITDNADKMAKPILGNLNFKKALWYAIDRQTLAKLECGYPANFVIPITSFTGTESNVRFRDTDAAKAYTEDINASYNPTLAKECFEKALKEEGLESVELELLIGADNAEYSICAQFLQEQFNKIFDGKFKLGIRELPSKTRLSTIKGWRTDVNSYDLGLALWSISDADTNPAEEMRVYSSAYWANCNAPYDCETVETLIWAKDLDNRWGQDEDFDVDIAAKMEKAHLESYQTIPMFERYDQYLLKEAVIPNVENPDQWIYWLFDLDNSMLK